MSDDGGAHDLPDEALRSALEFAVGIAAAGAKLRPALPSPAGLKPFLRFQRLPAPALTAVRAVVESDPTFLGRLGIAATTELVDEVGMLWLRRPEGWEVAAPDLWARSERASDVDDAGALRREIRRREAAERAATRSRVEVLELTERMARDKEASVGRERASVGEIERLSTELASQRSKIASLSATGKGAKASAREVEELHAELARVRDELAAVVAARDEALADRAGGDGSSVDAERLRVLLHEALAITGTSTRARQRKTRKAIAIPGGLYGDSEAAGEHLLRTAGVTVLVDGYNVAKLGWPDVALERQRSVLVDAAENLARRWGTLIHIIFDGASVVGAHTGRRRMVRISYSPAGVSADDVLRDEVAALDASRPVVVVTNDQAIVHDVRAAGANVVSSEVFLSLARK